MKTKTKIKTKKVAKTAKKKTSAVKSKAKTSSVTPKKKEKHYHVSYLGLLVAGVLILEGLLFSVATPADWEHGFEILNMKPAVSEAAQDFAEVFAPVISLTQSVNEFYIATADATIPLLNLSGAKEGFELVYLGAEGFYGQASIAMADLLGISHGLSQGNIAGIWLEN
jgi:hypothetical protein